MALEMLVNTHLILAVYRKVSLLHTEATSGVVIRVKITYQSNAPYIFYPGTKYRNLSLLHTEAPSGLYNKWPRQQAAQATSGVVICVQRRA